MSRGESVDDPGPFFTLLRDWTARDRHATVTTAQFVELAGQHAGTDLAAFFIAWLYRPALPAR